MYKAQHKRKHQLCVVPTSVSAFFGGIAVEVDGCGVEGLVGLSSPAQAIASASTRVGDERVLSLTREHHERRCRSTLAVTQSELQGRQAW